MSLKVANLPSNSLAYSNRVYMNKAQFEEMKTATNQTGETVNIVVGNFVFSAAGNSEVAYGDLAMNGLQRKSGPFTLSQVLPTTIFRAAMDVAVTSITIQLDLLKKDEKAPTKTFECEELSESFKLQFCGQIFAKNQELAMDFIGEKVTVLIETFEHAALGAGQPAGNNSNRAQVIQSTEIHWKKRTGTKSAIQFKGGSAQSRNDNLFKSDFDFSKMGIGGLGGEFQTIFRRAFAPRIFPGLVKELGMNFVRGMLLYGPPGCGKTLIARQIGKVLNAREPKIINGPEVLDKFVGGSEEKIRELFADAEKEQAEKGDESMLHIIIFDEMDAVMKQRGSTRDSTGVSDSIVNQLLSKIDGVDSLNNILIIGMTNRKDMIDEAILRPGRLEVHVEIGLPDEHGRGQIIGIHVSMMKEKNRMTEECLSKLPDLARLTKNYTGAEIEGLVRSAGDFNVQFYLDVHIFFIQFF